MLSAERLSAYLVYRLADPDEQSQAARFGGNANIRFEYTVVVDLYFGGPPPLEAGSVLVEKTLQIFTHRAAGNRLAALLKHN